MKNRKRHWREIAFAGLAFLFLLDACSFVLAQDGVRGLTTPESTFVMNAYNRLANGPPHNIVGRDADSNLVTVNCDSIAKTLRDQLRSGRVRVDSNMSERGRADHDGTPSTIDDLLSFSSDFMDSLLRGLISPVHLIEIGVHERAHKVETDTSDEMFSTEQLRNEILALELEKAIKCSMNVAADDPFFLVCKREIKDCRSDLDRLDKALQSVHLHPAAGHFCFLLGDSGVADTFASFTPSALGWYTHPLTGMRAGDMLIFRNQPPIPPSESRVVLCGGLPMGGYRSRVRAMGLYSDGTLREPPDVEQDFGPPLYPPLFFGAMAYDLTRNVFFVLDTVQRRILNMVDANGDLVPDEIAGEYAHPIWPGFLPLQEATGLDVATHRTLGFGLIIQRGDKHIPHVVQYEQHWLFLPDANGDNIAESCLEVPAYQFLNLLPAIEEEVIWAGETTVPVFGTWQHNMLVWKTDSFGGARSELLGTAHMSDLHMTCELSRPLLAGEFVLPVDELWSTSPSLATPVAYVTPTDLTLAFAEDSQLHLRWTAVDGATSYCIYSSEDCVTFFDTGLRADDTKIAFPAPPGGTRLCYRVTAEK
jgi:hypothetical protein